MAILGADAALDVDEEVDLDAVGEVATPQPVGGSDELGYIFVRRAEDRQRFVATEGFCGERAVSEREVVHGNLQPASCSDCATVPSVLEATDSVKQDKSSSRDRR